MILRLVSLHALELWMSLTKIPIKEQWWRSIGKLRVSQTFRRWIHTWFSCKARNVGSHAFDKREWRERSMFYKIDPYGHIIHNLAECSHSFFLNNDQVTDPALIDILRVLKKQTACHWLHFFFSAISNFIIALLSLRCPAFLSSVCIIYRSQINKYNSVCFRSFEKKKISLLHYLQCSRIVTIVYHNSKKLRHLKLLEEAVDHQLN